MNILSKIVDFTLAQLPAAKVACSQVKLDQQVLGMPQPADFRAALSTKKELSVIAEVKRASPSKGLLSTNFDHLQLARAYSAAGASAISVITEPEFFQGSPRYLQEVAAAVSLPVLRKDFIVDPYQIYQARAWGAAAFLLIVAVLEEGQLRDYLELGRSLGMCALVETHNLAEVKAALAAGAEIIGINNRDLRDFSVNIETTLSLLPQIPADKLVVSESGIGSPETIVKLRGAGVGAVLIGEAFLVAEDPKAEVERIVAAGR